MTLTNMDFTKLSQDAVDLLKQLISIPSISREEEDAANLIETYLKSANCDVHRHGNNIWVLSDDFDNSTPAILLNAHIDTVKPVSGWVHDPFTPTSEPDGRIIGLGSNDCGGGLVALMHVFLALRKDIHNLVFLASCEEEVSGKGGVESVIPLLPEIAFAIVGEPTGMEPAIAEKGLMVIDAVAHGKAGHAARHEGVNAIYEAIDDIQKLRENHFRKQSPLLGSVKTSVTIINAGTQHNVVPDECRFTIDVRSNECYSNQEIFNTLSTHLKSELKARSFRLNSSSISETHPFVQKCVAMGKKPFGSPTLSDQALMPFPSLKMGPGESSRSHTADEFILISEIEDAIKTYYELLKDLQPKHKLITP